MPSRPVTAAEVHFDELNSLTPENVRTVFHWVHEKIDSFATPLKRPPGNATGGSTLWAPDAADMFLLSEDGENICVSEQWKIFLKHQACQPSQGDDATSKTGDDLLLQWIYGNLVSEREKARDGAKRALYHGHVPDGQSVYSLLRAVRHSKLNIHGDAISGNGRNSLTELLFSGLEQTGKAEFSV